MSSLNGFAYHLDIYTSANCYRGEYKLADSRRISDILNDRSHPSLTLDDANLILWDDGSPQDCGGLGAITIVKRNVIVVVVGNAAHTAESGSQVMRVTKTPQRVTIYVPPIELTGNVHLSAGAELLNLLDSARLDFLPLTSAALRWLDGRAQLPNSAGLIFVNWHLISGVRTSATEAGSNTIELVDPGLNVQLLTMPVTG